MSDASVLNYFSFFIGKSGDTLTNQITAKSFEHWTSQLLGKIIEKNAASDTGVK